MSSFEWNKIIGAVLASMILAMVSGIVAGNLVKPTVPAKPAYVVASTEEPAAGQEAAAAPAGPEPIAPLLAKADPAAGKDAGEEMHGLPHLRQGRRQPHRPQPVERDRRAHRRGSRRLRVLLGAQRT